MVDRLGKPSMNLSRARALSPALLTLHLLVLLAAGPAALGTQGVQGVQGAQADPDLPAAAGDRIDKATYLRLRGEHVAALRGLKTPVPANARAKAIRQLEQQERAAVRLRAA